MRRLIAIDADTDATGTQCSWLVLGSSARSEPLPGSDLDTAVAWADEPGQPSHFSRVQAVGGAAT